MGDIDHRAEFTLGIGQRDLNWGAICDVGEYEDFR